MIKDHFLVFVCVYGYIQELGLPIAYMKLVFQYSNSIGCEKDNNLYKGLITTPQKVNYISHFLYLWRND